MNPTPTLPPNFDVAMYCPDLHRCPIYLPHEPFRLRGYRTGDEKHWLDIHLQADKYNTITPALFAAQFAGGPALLAERQIYLLDEDKPVGTATAWRRPWSDGGDIGVVHWLAILPAWQGQGLSRPLLSAVCRRLLSLGHTRAYLGTSTLRLPAINLYWRFGFRPYLRGPEDEQAWDQVRPFLKSTDVTESSQK